MKKLYTEPIMVVEDFTVSEMVAKNCGIVENELTFTQQFSGDKGPCSGDLGDANRNNIYAIFSDLAEVDSNPEDTDKDGDPWNDVLFTQALRDQAIKVAYHEADICNVISTDTFNGDQFAEFRCTDDSQLIQNS